MFKLFKKSYNLVAPVSGRVINLSSVPDKVFAQRMAGDGVAIESTGDTIVAPADGMLTLIFRTNHAFGITLDNGIEVLVHIGLDTVELEGKGFERIAEQGASIKAGEPIIKLDRKFILSENRSLITPVLITNIDAVLSIEPLTGSEVTAGEDNILTYMLK